MQLDHEKVFFSFQSPFAKIRHLLYNFVKLGIKHICKSLSMLLYIFIIYAKPLQRNTFSKSDKSPSGWSIRLGIILKEETAVVIDMISVKIELFDGALETCILGKVFEVCNSAFTGKDPTEHPRSVTLCRIMGKFRLERENV